jgi:hypothetical protein
MGGSLIDHDGYGMEHGTVLASSRKTTATLSP